MGHPTKGDPVSVKGPVRGSRLRKGDRRIAAAYQNGVANPAAAGHHLDDAIPQFAAQQFRESHSKHIPGSARLHRADLDGSRVPGRVGATAK